MLCMLYLQFAHKNVFKKKVLSVFMIVIFNVICQQA